MAVGIIKSIEACAITVNSTQTYVDYTLTKGQDIDNCVPFATWVLTSTSYLTPDNFMFDVYFLSSPNRVRVQRNNSQSTINVSVYVVEFEPSKVKVQQGTFELASVNTDTPTLAESVTTGNTAMVYYWRYNSSTQTVSHYFIGGYVKSSTEVEFQRYSTTNTCTGHYHVFEALDGDFTVSHYAPGESSSQSFDISIPEVNLDNTFLIDGYKTADTSAYPEEATFLARFSSSTNVSIYRWANSGDISRHFVQVIKAPDDRIFVQHRYIYEATAAATEWTLPSPVDPDRAIAHNPTVFPGARTDGTTMGLGIYRHTLINDGETLRMERYSTGDDCYMVGQVIEFTATEYFCEGTVSVDDTLTSGVEVRLFRRSDSELVGSATTTVSGTFSIPTRHHDEYHFAIAMSNWETTNSLIYDWISPTISG